VREVFCGRGVAAKTKGFSCGTDFASRCYFGILAGSISVRFFMLICKVFPPKATSSILGGILCQQQKSFIIRF
jgi:hypothetical protein